MQILAGAEAEKEMEAAPAGAEDAKGDEPGKPAKKVVGGGGRRSLGSSGRGESGAAAVAAGTAQGEGGPTRADVGRAQDPLQAAGLDGCEGSRRCWETRLELES